MTSISEGCAHVSICDCSSSEGCAHVSMCDCSSSEGCAHVSTCDCSSSERCAHESGNNCFLVYLFFEMVHTATIIQHSVLECDVYC